MKKTYVLIINIILCLLLFACNTNSLNTISENEVGDDHNSSAVSSTVSIEFDSLGELQNALNLENENKLFSYFLEQGVGSKQIEIIRNMVKTIRLRNNIVPYLDGKVIELRNEEGFGNITMFSSEKYGLPCIFYHPTVFNSENLYIKVTCIPDEFLHERETPIASDLIKIMAPDYPNTDNTGNYCSAVYNTNIKLLDCEVTALVYEYKTDKRNSTLFVYDNLLIEVRNDPEIWGMNWFSTLSFSGF